MAAQHPGGLAGPPADIPVVPTGDTPYLAQGPVPHMRRLSSGALMFLLWGLFSALMIGVAVRDYLREGGDAWWQPVLWEGSSMLVGGLLLLVRGRARRLYAPHLAQPWRWFLHHLKWLPLAALVFIAAVFAMRHAVYGLLGLTYHHDPLLLLLPYEAAKFGMFACLWLGVIFSLDSHAHWQAQQQRLLVLQKALAEAQLAQLSAQLHPHFLFNALNTISALMHLDVARADRLLASLGDLLRASLQSSPQEQIPLRRELQLLELYAQVMAERFADRVQLEWQIDPSTMQVAVPALLLQPLLENAFKHGVERARAVVRIRIRARRDGVRLLLSVSNTGTDLPDAAPEGVGLRNCRERLAAFHGPDASLRITGNSGEVEARVLIPWREIAA